MTFVGLVINDKRMPRLDGVEVEKSYLTFGNIRSRSGDNIGMCVGT